MRLERFFRIVSYATVFCGFLSLWVSGSFGPLATGLFLAVFVGAALLEDTRFQIGEKLGTALIVLALPVFYGLWASDMVGPTGNGPWIAGLLARMILALTAIKLLQRKSDRDWIFLYLMAFFEVLLAAGLSISILYLFSFITYLILMTCAIVAFEVRKTARNVKHSIEGSTANKRTEISDSDITMRPRRIPSVAISLILFIVLLAVPLFFVLPRAGGASFAGDQRGLTTSGFSDRVTLGNFGRITEDDSVVMRVKLDGLPAITSDLYFRGVALDTFDNRAWSRSKPASGMQMVRAPSSSTVRVGLPSERPRLVDQLVYLEPLDTPVLFAVPRAIAAQGTFESLSLDSYGALSHSRGGERLSYRVTSDLAVPLSSDLRADDRPYGAEFSNYLALPPSTDPRISELAKQVTDRLQTRYDKALAVESHLQTSYGYTLELKASGQQPLADFLFNVREGHCEYFASAMAVMLRTQGIATRIVNGFHGGEYNETVGMTVVRQSHAHAWVEVYFPGLDAWIKFDPTPPGGQPGGAGGTGFTATMRKYVEAIETVWIQYFVSYDDREQKTLGRSFRTEFLNYQSKLSSYLGITTNMAAEWFAEVRGEKGLGASIKAVLWAAGALLGGVLVIAGLIWLSRKLIASGIWRRWIRRRSDGPGRSRIEFYENMLEIVGRQGFRRETWQTPLEFAYAVGTPEVLAVTESYQQVRFGRHEMTQEENAHINDLLTAIETKKGGKIDEQKN